MKVLGEGVLRDLRIWAIGVYWVLGRAVWRKREGRRKGRRRMDDGRGGAMIEMEIVLAMWFVGGGVGTRGTYLDRR